MQTGSDQEQVGTEILEITRDPNLLGLRILETDQDLGLSTAGSVEQWGSLD